MAVVAEVVPVVVALAGGAVPVAEASTVGVALAVGGQTVAVLAAGVVTALHRSGVRSALQAADLPPSVTLGDRTVLAVAVMGHQVAEPSPGHLTERVDRWAVVVPVPVVLGPVSTAVGAIPVSTPGGAVTAAGQAIRAVREGRWGRGRDSVS